MLAGLEGGQRPFPVEAVGEGDVDSVDVGILDHRLVAVGHSRNPVAGGKSGGPVAIPGPYQLDSDFLIACGRSDEGGRGDPRAAPNSPNLTTVDVMTCWLSSGDRPWREPLTAVSAAT